MKRAKEIIREARSCRRYTTKVVTEDDLLYLIDVARLTPSAGNKQTLRFAPVVEDTTCQAIYRTLKWAGYLKDWEGPTEEERPRGYIIIWHDVEKGAYNEIDLGIAAQSINFAARADLDLATCMIGAFDHNAIRRVMEIEEESLEPKLVMAIGGPKERITIDDIQAGDVKYWRDAEEVHHVPKRTVDQLLIRKKWQR